MSPSIGFFRLPKNSTARCGRSQQKRRSSPYSMTCCPSNFTAACVELLYRSSPNERPTMKVEPREGLRALPLNSVKIKNEGRAVWRSARPSLTAVQLRLTSAIWRRRCCRRESARRPSRGRLLSLRRRDSRPLRRPGYESCERSWSCCLRKRKRHSFP
jgi:hypothetical protein